MFVIISSGKSFKGLVDYITHDARDQAGDRPTTRNRVAWELCENLPTSDVDLAARIMASTVRDAPALKAAAGVSARGRKCVSPVLHIVMSWPKGAKVTAAEQFSAADSLLKHLGLEDRQRVLVSHRDKRHDHIHIAVNRISSVDGRAASSSHERRKASTWAERYEREHRCRIECPARVENRERRERRAGERPVRTAPKRRRRDTGEAVDPLPGETMLWRVHYKTWAHIPADDLSARRARRELARDLEVVRDDAGPAPGATLQLGSVPTPPRYSSAEIDAEERRRMEQAFRRIPEAIRGEALAHAAAPPRAAPPAPKSAPRILAQEIQRLDRQIIDHAAAAAPVVVEDTVPAVREVIEDHTSRAADIVAAASARAEAAAQRRPDAAAAAAPDPAAADQAAIEEQERAETERIRAEEQERIRTEERAETERIRAQFAALGEAASEEVYDIAARIAADQPGDLPWDQVNLDVDARHASDPTYQQQIKVGDQVLDVGSLRMGIEIDILEQAEALHSTRRPSAPPNGLAAAVATTATAIRTAVRQILERILDQVLPERHERTAHDATDATPGRRVHDQAPTAQETAAARAVPKQAPSARPPAPPPAARQAEDTSDRGAGEDAGGADRPQERRSPDRRR